MTKHASSIPISYNNEIRKGVSIKDIYLRVLFPLVIWVVRFCCRIPQTLVYKLLTYCMMLHFPVALSNSIAMQNSESSKNTPSLGDKMLTCDKATQYEKPNSTFIKFWKGVFSNVNDENRNETKSLEGIKDIKMFGTAKTQVVPICAKKSPGFAERIMTTVGLYQVDKSGLSLPTQTQKVEKGTECENFLTTHQNNPLTIHKEFDMPSKLNDVNDKDDTPDGLNVNESENKAELETNIPVSAKIETETEDDEIKILEKQKQELQRKLEEEKRKQEQISQQQQQRKKKECSFVVMHVHLHMFNKTVNKPTKKFETWLDQPD